MYQTNIIDLKSQSKCTSSPSVKVVNTETRNESLLVAHFRAYKHYINPKELTDHIVDYMSDAFGKCQIKVDASSPKVIEVSLDKAEMKLIGPFNARGAGIQLKINIPETQYQKIYSAEEWTPRSAMATMAFAIHLTIRKVIEDPIVQNYILCNTNKPYSNKISIVAGTYGGNCGVAYGNRTEHLAKMCSGLSQCEYIINEEIIGDLDAGCKKNFEVEWRCGRDTVLHKIIVQPEAVNQKKITLSCP